VPLSISLLGPPRVERDGQPVSFDTRKATALLAHLALAERPRSREALCDLLWPGRDPDHARGALRRTLSTLRSAVGAERVATEGDSVAFLADQAVELDVERFRALAADDATLDDLAAAVALFRGELLEGFGLRDSPDFDAWQLAEADALRRELGSALGRLVGLLAARGDYERAIPYGRRWLALDPLHEPAHRELIRLLAWSDDRAAALAQYRDCVRTLSQELGVGPVEETAALFDQVSQGTLAPPAPPRAPAPPRHATAPAELPLVGRDEELETLVAAHRSAAPDGRLAVIEGEAGIGKTRLARELAESVGAVALGARCHEDEAGLPYGPIVDLLAAALQDAERWVGAVPQQRLADASLLAPELAGLREDTPVPLTHGGPGARTRLLDGVAAVLTAACAGGIVFVDDVHAADEATLDVLTYLGRRLRGRPLLLLLAWRSEAVQPGHRLRRLAADLAPNVTVVQLGRLSEALVADLVHASYSGEPSAGLDRRVYLESEGLPLFVAEYLAALGDERETQSFTGARLGGLSAVADQVLGAGAAIGRSFDLDVVRDVSGRSDEEVVAAVEELAARGIVREVEGAYDFTHQRLRALAYEQTSLARRRLLHRRAADALARRAEGAAQLAHHLGLAGDQTAAAEQHRLAGEHAARLLAHRDALEHLESALALGHPEVAALHERIGDLRTLVGDYAGALASYETAAAHCKPEALAAIEHKLGNVHARRGEWERAETRLEAALGAAAAGADALRARIKADLGLTLQQRGDGARATELAHAARELAEAAADRRAQAQAHNMLGVLARGAGDLHTANAELRRSAALAEQLGDAEALTAALNNLALVSRDAGDLDGALELTERALALCAAYGDRHREAALENNLADLHHAAGRADESMAHLKRAVTLFAEVGADEATRLPAIWKLVSW
jgi:DNA-binding SARP family transcriptional activator/predicted ATPase